MLKGVHVHVNVVISINMYGNAQGAVVNKTWEQVMAALLYSSWMLISEALIVKASQYPVQMSLRSAVMLK